MPTREACRQADTLQEHTPLTKRFRTPRVARQCEHVGVFEVTGVATTPQQLAKGCDHGGKAVTRRGLLQSGMPLDCRTGRSISSLQLPPGCL